MNDDKRDPLKDVEICDEDGETNESVVETKIVEMARVLRYWGEKQAAWSQHVKELNLDFDIWFAKKKDAAVQIKVAGMEEKDRRYFLKELKDVAKRDLVMAAHGEEYSKLQKDIFAAERKMEEISKLNRALEQKSELLRTLAANYRKEWRGTQS